MFPGAFTSFIFLTCFYLCFYHADFSMDDKSLFVALPLGKQATCPVCIRRDWSVTYSALDGLKRHLNKDHGNGWNIVFVCCDTLFSCQDKRYAKKEAKKHFEEAHPEVPVEVDADYVLSDTYDGLQEAILLVANRANPAAGSPPPVAPPASPSPSPASPVPRRARRPPRQVRRREAQQDPDLTPRRLPIHQAPSSTEVQSSDPEPAVRAQDFLQDPPEPAPAAREDPVSDETLDLLTGNAIG